MRTLPSLKKLYQQKVDKMTENMEGKPKQEKQGEEKQKLHAAMDKELEKICTQLAICNEEGDTDGWWKGWSQAIEKASLST